ncbi:hypothetical protein BDV25DRAFT_132258 [Aspergillus avenaceus]|uniref:Uncharacterized protein n=1 Tax=Aspergillus avenaceus TaxID=36643 RepID=A0A5N6TM98_ASPAV|nr:hypothetical protein BDV25DRAFT_132258 [Aspergillus avenaceus]
MFITSTIPTIHHNTIIVAATHPTVSSGRQVRDGWFLSDFYAFNYLLKDQGLEQTWLTAADPERLLERNGNYLHGNPYETRKVVLSHSLLQGNKLSPVTVVKPNEMIARFLHEVRRASQVARRQAAPVLLLVFCHGLPNHELALDNGSKNKGLSITRLRGVLEPGVSVCLMTSACYSGGWVVNPDFNHTTLAAATGSADSTGQSNAWPNSESIGRACGSVFASVMIESLSSATSPLLDNPQRSASPLQPEEPTKQQVMTYNSFCSSIWEVCQARVHRLWESQNFTFSAQDDQWEYSWMGRTGIPLREFGERWEYLTSVPYTGPADVRNFRNPSPYNPMFIEAANNAMTAGTPQVEDTRKNIFLERIRDLAQTFIQTCPGDWSFGREVAFGGLLRDLYQCPETLDEEELMEGFLAMRFRVEFSFLVDLLITRFQLPVPFGDPCLTWRRVEWEQAMTSQLPGWRNRYRAIIDFLRDGGFDFEPASGQGPPFLRPTWYVAAAILELMWSREDTNAITSTICRYVEDTRRSQRDVISAEPRVRQAGKEWLKTVGKRVRRSLSPRKHIL